MSGNSQKTEIRLLKKELTKYQILQKEEIVCSLEADY